MIQSLFLWIFVCVVLIALNVAIAGCIHGIRNTPSKKTSILSILMLLCAPYMIYLVVTKQGRVIDAIATNENDKIKEYFKAYFKAYKEENKDS